MSLVSSHVSHLIIYILTSRSHHRSSSVLDVSIHVPASYHEDCTGKPTSRGQTYYLRYAPNLPLNSGAPAALNCTSQLSRTQLYCRSSPLLLQVNLLTSEAYRGIVSFRWPTDLSRPTHLKPTGSFHKILFIASEHVPPTAAPNRPDKSTSLWESVPTSSVE